MKIDPRFLTEHGLEIFTGNELLLKGALETDGGVHLLGGYPGSPVSGFFDAMAAVKDLLVEKGIRAVMNNNEALAAAMLNGLQTLPCRGMIVMKSVGVHVAADALALCNLAGANPKGGALVVYGDDPWSDSTQVPSDSRYISKHLFIPVIEPANPQEVKDFVGASFELSAASELFAGYLLSTNLADGGGTVQCRPNRYPDFSTIRKIDLETALIPQDKRVLLPPRTWWQEGTLAERFERAKLSARRLGLNRIDNPCRSRAAIGFITSGMAHAYLVQVLWEIGLLGEFPILKFGMSYPLDEGMVELLAGQCERIVVVEERRGFIEEQVNQALTQARLDGKLADLPEVYGKKFPQGLAGIPDTRGLHPSIITSRLVPLIKLLAGSAKSVQLPAGCRAMDLEIETIAATGMVDVSPMPARTPTFCPGCPHRDSAGACLEIKRRFMDPDYMHRTYRRGPVDLLFHGDTGCYTMLIFPPNGTLMHDYSGMGLGGGTGAGTDPFVTNKEVVFMGDSTFFHSGQLAISQAIKLGQDITFIILDNATTAMTGHQPTPGVDYDIIGNPTAVQDIESIVQGIAGQGEVPVVCADPQQRQAYIRLLERTFLADGVKVVIADKECGITRMRRQRRQERQQALRLGYLPCWQHTNINPEICRFCLACSEMTGCPGLKHVQTDYGPKMDTDLTTCVNDGACSRVGACCAFEQVTIKRRRPPRSRLPELGLDDIPEPTRSQPTDIWRCCLAGVGGMGIGLATQIVVRAGHKEGYQVLFLDKKGLAIRNGGVSSQVVYNISNQPITAIIPFGKADLLVGVDVLESARALEPAGRMRISSPSRTAAVINTAKIQTIQGLMGKDDFDPVQLESIIRAQTRPQDTLARDISRICEKYLGSKLFANTMMLGFAFQKGLIPVSMHSMAWAIKDTIKSDFRKNLYAFNMGRKLVVSPELFQGPARRGGWREVLEDKHRCVIRRYLGRAALADGFTGIVAEFMGQAQPMDEKLKSALVVRAYDCLRWGGIKYARRYLKGVRSVWMKDSGQFGYAATEAVVYNLASAMLIKDPIFIAELATSPDKYARDRNKYSVNPANGDRIAYRHLLSGTLELMGRRINVRLAARPWMLRCVKRLRWLRPILPGQARRRIFLRQYEGLLENFNYKNSAEYQQQLSALASPDCMECMNPLCRQEGCPLESSVPQWSALALGGNWRSAWDLLQRDNNFPEFTSRVCPAPCQDACKRGKSGFSVQIRRLEQQIADRALAEGWIDSPSPADPTGRKVAIVGSGPAGLAAGLQLTRAGHRVTIFEKDTSPGGLLRYGIPRHRLDRALLDRRIAQMQKEGVEFRTAAHVGKDIPADELLRQYDAILLACGASRPRELKVPGRGLKGVYFAMDFLRQDQQQIEKTIDVEDKTVVVIGGGLTGEDCVCAALMNGAKMVHQFEILPRPANYSPQHLTDEPDRVSRQWCVVTQAFDGTNDQLGEIHSSRVRWSSLGDGAVMKIAPESEFRTKADVALLAIGYDPVIDDDLANQLGLELGPDGRVICEDHSTNLEGVYVAGDLSAGSAFVASAIASGRRAARRIDGFLSRHASKKPQ